MLNIDVIDLTKVCVCVCVCAHPRELLPSVSEEYLPFLQRTTASQSIWEEAIGEAKGKFNFCIMDAMGLDLGGLMWEPKQSLANW